MKRCPACNRDYADETLNFCLEDGSILSVPDDPEKTRQIFSAQETDSIVTKVLSAESKAPGDTQPLMPTMPSPQIPPDFAQKAQYQTRIERTGSKLWLVIGLLAFLVVSLLGIVVWLSATKTPTNTNTNTNIVVKNQNANQPISNDFSERDKESDTIFKPLDYRASLNGENLTYYPGTTVEKCKADCAKNERCRGFTFIRAGAYNPNDSAMCYLASKVTGSVPHDCCISAVKR